jgi:membrane protein
LCPASPFPVALVLRLRKTLQKSPHAEPRPRLLNSLLIVAGALAVAAFRRDEPRAPSHPLAALPHRGEPLVRQLLRARERGRGREATSPAHIPWKGWKDILWRTASRVSQNRLLAISAGVVFYGLLALFPAITALVSAYGLFAASDTIRGHLSFAADVMPADAFSIVQDQISRVVAKGDAKLSFAFVFGFGFALWSANAGMKAIIDALNEVYDEDEKRGFVLLNVTSLAFTAGAITALLVALGAVVVTPLVLEPVGFATLTESIVRLVRWPALMLGMLAGLAILYRYGPSRREARWKWLSVGAVVATLAWFAGSAALSYYLANYANYDATYGSLGTAIGTMIWMWMSAIVVLFGAALNSEIEHQTARDTTVGADKPLGARGATMADTVGPAQTA